MNDPALDAFLADVLPRQIAADRALHDGDPAPRLALWSDREPVTLFGAARSERGRAALADVFRWWAARFSDCASFAFEPVAAGVGGDLAYTVGYERTTAAIDGVPAAPYALRVTHVYRREAGAWKIVHRHADPMAGGDPPPLGQG